MVLPNVAVYEADFSLPLMVIAIPTPTLGQSASPAYIENGSKSENADATTLHNCKPRLNTQADHTVT
jgi:hypothetical protein